MKTLLSQGFSRSLLSLATCGYLPYSRQNSLNLATHHPQEYPGSLRSSLRRGDARKSRSADSLGRSNRCEQTRGGSVPLASSCEVSSDLIRANERLGHDRIRIISITRGRQAADRHRMDHRRVVFLQGESRSKCHGRCDRGNRRAFTGTNNTRIEPGQGRRKAESAATTARVACIVTHLRELRSAITLRRKTASNSPTFVTPAKLPRIAVSRVRPMAPSGTGSISSSAWTPPISLEQAMGALHCRDGYLTRRRNVRVSAFCSLGSGARQRGGTNVADETGPSQIFEDTFFELDLRT